ncbi:hypothetical protein PIB30_003576 [Stylosanthes scabra]|uniref:Uncharacterized protein n=1 Tax=Stylosanthes scabra TaxID=79078 RepID=A0ABU6X4A8_9FABA|nr:hypothetical protein [Stylosanthes scabra]
MSWCVFILDEDEDGHAIKVGGRTILDGRYVSAEARQTAKSELHSAGGAGVTGENNRAAMEMEDNGVTVWGRGGVLLVLRRRLGRVTRTSLLGGSDATTTDRSNEPTPPNPRAWSICCLNPCAMSWAAEALVIVASQTSSTPAEVSCSHVVSVSSLTTADYVCWSEGYGGGARCGPPDVFSPICGRQDCVDVHRFHRYRPVCFELSHHPVHVVHVNQVEADNGDD